MTLKTTLITVTSITTKTIHQLTIKTNISLMMISIIPLKVLCIHDDDALTMVVATAIYYSVAILKGVISTSCHPGE